MFLRAQFVKVNAARAILSALNIRDRFTAGHGVVAGSKNNLKII